MNTPLPPFVLLPPRRIAALLVVIGLALAGVDAVFEILGHHLNSEDLWPISRQFDFSEEGNLVNWYQSMTLLLCAALLALIAVATRRLGRPGFGHWAGLAVVFTLVSIDEAAQVHETTVAPLIQRWRGGAATRPPGSASARNTAAATADEPEEHAEAQGKLLWMAPYLVVLAVLGAVYFRFFLRLGPGVRAGFIAAAILYLGGAVVVERALGSLSIRHGDNDLTAQLVSTFSELLEMLGVAAFVHALLSHLAATVGPVTVAAETPAAT